MKTKTINVTLSGIRPIMFDRYNGMNGQDVSMEQKFYLAENQKNLILPAINIFSFLTADLTESATKQIYGRAWKKIARAAKSFVDLDPIEIPFTREGKALTLDNSDWKTHHAVARMKKGGGGLVPNEVSRPYLEAPWELAFKITLYDNPDINENTLKHIFEEGGIRVGLGAYRGVYGKFEIAKWN